MLAALAVLYFLASNYREFVGRQAFKETGLVPLSLEEAKALSRKTNKPILVEMSADWCGYCYKFHKEVLSDPRVFEKINDRYVFSLVDFDEPSTSDFKHTYQLFQVPAMVIIDSEGMLIRRVKISYAPDLILRELEM